MEDLKNFQKLGGAKFLGGAKRFWPKSQLNISKSMTNIDTSSMFIQFDPENILEF